jgi:tetratricopeptide (TPR) repeat protein
MARLLERRGNFAHALALWEMVRTALPNDQEAKNKAKDLAASDTIIRGHYQAALEKPTDAAIEIKPATAVRETPSGPRSAKVPTSDAVDAEAARWRTAIQQDPTSACAYLNLAACYRRAGKLVEAGKVLEEGLGPTGRDFEISVQLAELDIEPFRRDLAIAEQRLRSRPDDEELSEHCTQLAKEINTRELELYRQRAEHYSADKNYRFEFGVRLFRAGQLDEAIRELQAVRADPRHQWRALSYLGQCFQARNIWPLAERNFAEALKHLPAEEEASRKELLFRLASGSANAGDFSKAIELGYELANIDFGYRNIGELLGEWQTLQRQPADRGAPS